VSHRLPAALILSPDVVVSGLPRLAAAATPVSREYPNTEVSFSLSGSIAIFETVVAPEPAALACVAPGGVGLMEGRHAR
jgi:hypothetical protein